MIKRQYNKAVRWIEKNRFYLLLLSTILVLVLPAYSGTGMLSKILFWVTMTFLFLQSLVVANVRKSRKRVIRIITIAMILITWLQPIGIKSNLIDILRNASFAVFFIFIIRYLFKFINRSERVNQHVLITAVNIYLLLGIVGGCLAWLLFKIYPDAYNFPGELNENPFVPFVYYSFITMTTVGYGDFTPRIPETQTLAYFLAITGQLYVAIIIAFIVGKLMTQPHDDKAVQKEGPDD
jgi:voltage-gated potassium channel